MTARHALGCDIVALDEIRRSLESFGDRFLRRIFTEGELSASDDGRDIARLAARFAAKEAVIKALAVVDEPTVPTEIEVIGAGGVPTVAMWGAMAERSRARGWGTLQLSLSHTDCHAMAVVIADVDPDA